MNLIKLSTGFYPYTLSELRRDNPNVSFPSDLTGVDLSIYDAAEVITDSAPSYDPKSESIEPLPPKKVQGSWKVQWKKRALSQKEIKSRVPADWLGFYDALSEDTEFNRCFNVVSQDYPLITYRLAADLMGDPQRLTILSNRWEKFCQKANVDSLQREQWAALAETFSLPDNFIARLRNSESGLNAGELM
jgi:transposase